MQNPCSCHWLELTDFLSKSRSSRKDKEIWGNKLFSRYLGARWGAHAAPIETVAGCPPRAGGSTAFLRGSLLKMDLVWREKIDTEDIPFTSLGCFHIFLFCKKKKNKNKKVGPPSAVFTRSNVVPLGFGTMLTLPLSEVIRTHAVVKGGDKCQSKLSYPTL